MIITEHFLYEGFWYPRIESESSTDLVPGQFICCDRAQGGFWGAIGLVLSIELGQSDTKKARVMWTVRHR
jgi:hypothetical protein